MFLITLQNSVENTSAGVSFKSTYFVELLSTAASEQFWQVAVVNSLQLIGICSCQYCFEYGARSQIFFQNR